MSATFVSNQSYYEILGVHATASPEEIKRRFRRLVKECHPDQNRHREVWAGRQVRLLLEAYRTLSDSQKRWAYDQTRVRLSPHDDGKHPRRARPRPITLYDQAMMVLLDLMAGNGGAAVAAYEALCRDREDFSLLTYLSVRDYLDCLFLLGEEYERQGQFEKALELYAELYREEHAEPRRRYFFDEVRDRIRNIYCRDLARAAPPHVALDYYRRLLEMALGKTEDAFLHKKMAECHYRLGDYATARRELEQAFSLKPNLKGAQKISAKLGTVSAAASQTR